MQPAPSKTGDAEVAASGVTTIVWGGAVKFILNSNSNRFQIKFKSFQTLANPKRTFLSSKKIEIKYGCEIFEERNNFLHRNFFRFKTDFELTI
jgi:hypothetical protein